MAILTINAIAVSLDRADAWQAATTVIALSAFILSLRNYWFQRSLTRRKWSLKCRIERVTRQNRSIRRLRITLDNEGQIPIHLHDFGLEADGSAELLKCKWPKDRTETPAALDRGCAAIADYYEDEIPLTPIHAKVKQVKAILTNGAVLKCRGRALRKWRRIAVSYQPPR
jgi:hypothetical protein